jgi:hypothetical protein
LREKQGDYTIWIVNEDVYCGNYHATLKVYANTHYAVTIDTGVSLIVGIVSRVLF